MKYIFANWKMYLSLAESVALAEELARRRLASDGEQTLAVFPMALAIPDIVRALSGSDIELGAQNCSYAPRGAYTGAISAEIFRSAGCRYVLVGHSERRYIFGETDSVVQKKIEASLSADLAPVLCIGETKDELDAGKRSYRLKKQLLTAFSGIDLNANKVLVAYEPVWAIGTGESCNPADADDVHGWIREELRQYGGTKTPIIYGGSVDEKNAGDYLSLPTVDGLLVGGASVNIDRFAAIAAAARL